MKNIKKALLSVMLVVALAFSVVSCGNMFVDYGKNNSGTVSVSNVEFNIKYTQTASEPSTLVEVLKEIRPSVVEIYVQTSEGTASGSGVVVGIDSAKNSAIIVTCHHVIEGGTKMVVKSVNGDEFDDVAIVGSDPKSDVGVITIVGEKVSGLSTATWYAGNSDGSEYIDVGTSVVAIGNPLGVLGGTVTSGIISAVNREVTVEGKSMVLLQTDAAINGGNSGGGLFNASNGDLVGIVNAGYNSSAAQGLSFAIAGNTAKTKFEALCSTYKAGESYGYIEGNFDLGAEFSVYESAFYFRREYYVGISSLDSYGDFAKAGLQVQDLIQSVKIADNAEFTISSVTTDTVTNLQNYLSKAKLNDKVTVKYVRGSDGVERTVSFTVSQYIYGQA